MRPLNRPASREEQTVETAASGVFDLQEFETGFGVRRDPKRKPPGEGWIIPPVREGSEYRTGDICIKQAEGAVGGFFSGGNTQSTPNGNRIEIRIQRDGRWEPPASDQEAQRIMSMLERSGSDSQQGERPEQDSSNRNQSQQSGGDEVEWTPDEERQFEQAIRSLEGLGNDGGFSRFNAAKIWQKENGYEADGRLTRDQYEEVMRQYRESRSRGRSR